MITNILTTIHFLAPQMTRPSLSFGVDEELLQKYADAPPVPIADALGMRKDGRVSITGTVQEVSAFENVLVIGVDNGLHPLRCQPLLKPWQAIVNPTLTNKFHMNGIWNSNQTNIFVN